MSFIVTYSFFRKTLNDLVFIPVFPNTFKKTYDTISSSLNGFQSIPSNQVYYNEVFLDFFLKFQGNSFACLNWF
jgi:hypothetical protein